MAQGDLIIGRGVRVEVGKTEGSAKTVTAITLADPGVATSTAHGLTTKSVGRDKLLWAIFLVSASVTEFNPIWAYGPKPLGFVQVLRNSAFCVVAWAAR